MIKMFGKQIVNKLITSKVINKRLLSTNYGLVYEEFGEPLKVLKKVELKDQIDGPLEGRQVLIAYKASPINPADINTIQGVYAIKPKLPAIAGNEGVAEVVKVGSEVSNLKVGDRVLPTLSASGTWRTYSIMDSKDLMKVDSDLDPMSAAQLTVNPCTAYRMLKDFVQLEKGDTVLQNGANSAVGLYAIQLAKQWSLKTVNVIRNRPDTDSLRERLLKLGANHVITEEDLRKKEVMESIFKDVQKPKLALNCIGGKNATDCMRHLAFKGVMVTYGGMSRQPLTIPTGSLIFSDHRFVGFWMTRWHKENSKNNERSRMITELSQLLKEGKIQTPKTTAVSLDDFKDAIEKSMSGFVDGKYIFVMN